MKFGIGYRGDGEGRGSGGWPGGDNPSPLHIHILLRHGSVNKYKDFLCDVTAYFFSIVMERYKKSRANVGVVELLAP